MYHLAVRHQPGMKTRYVFPLRDIPAHIIQEPPPSEIVSAKPSLFKLRKSHLWATINLASLITTMETHSTLVDEQDGLPLLKATINVFPSKFESHSQFWAFSGLSCSEVGFL